MKDSVFPVGLRLSDRLCLVVGSNRDALDRVQSLLQAGARVRFVTELDDDATARVDSSANVKVLRRAFAESDLDDVWFSVLTDMDAQLAARIFEAAEARRVFFCALDQPDFGNYAHLARVKEGPLVVAISTNGKAPAMARRLQQELARVFQEARIGTFLEALGLYRARLPREQRREALIRLVSKIRFTGRLELPDVPEAQDP